MQQIVDFCYRFSHFHPDRYKASDRPEFSGSIAEVVTPPSDDQKLKYGDVYTCGVKPRTTAEAANTRKHAQNKVAEVVIATSIVGGALYYSNVVLGNDRQPHNG